MNTLYHRYRPKTWDDVVGQDRAIERIHRLNGFGGRAFWLSGPSGVGKSTLAALIAGEIASEFGIEELDAAEITGDHVRDIERKSSTTCIGDKGGRAYIVNESQSLKPTAVKQLLVTLERIPNHVTWIFTTIDGGGSLFGADVKGHPLLSRCIDVQLDGGKDVELEFAIRAREIARKEGVDGRPLDFYLQLTRENRWNLRKVIQEIEAGAAMA